MVSENNIQPFDLDWSYYRPPPLAYPPPYFWKENLFKEKIPTPVDDRGIVKIDELVDTVLDQVEPSYVWNAEDLDVHHVLWWAALYPVIKNGDAGTNPAFYRDLPVNKILVPRGFHEFMHFATLPPAVVDQEVMRHRVKSWQLAWRLFVRADVALRRWSHIVEDRPMLIKSGKIILNEALKGEDRVGHEYLLTVLNKHFKDIDIFLAQQEEIPKELRVINLEEDSDVASSIIKVAKFVTGQSLDFVNAVTDKKAA